MRGSLVLSRENEIDQRELSKSYLSPLWFLSGLIPLQSKTKIKIFLVIIITGIFISSGVLFSLLPTSIFGEASDINHDQRDELVMSVSRDPNTTFATTDAGLLRTLDLYKKFWNQISYDDLEIGKVETETTLEGTELITVPADAYKLIGSIIAFESGDTYEGALAVASCVVNRIAEGNFVYDWDRLETIPECQLEYDPLAILTSENQFEAYMDYYYLQYYNNIPAQVDRAIRDCFIYGKRNHSFTSFRSYETSNSFYIEGNYYFDPTEKVNDWIRYSILGNTDPESERNDLSFNNTDPDGLRDWDLLYLISAYDASKINLEGTVVDEENTPISRYKDLIYGVGDYILKAAFGTTIEIKREERVESFYPVYSEETITVLEGDRILQRTYYKQVGESCTKIDLWLPEYRPVSVIELVPVEIIPEQNASEIFLGQDGSYQIVLREDLFEQTGNIVEFKPPVVEITEEKRVAGLQKAVLLDVLGLSPNEPYRGLRLPGTFTITNSDYIEGSRRAMIEVLKLRSGPFSFDSNSYLQNYQNALNASDFGWVWPLDPEGTGAFTITSLMGDRDSPGGIGSTDHGGTDIGAIEGVAVIAVEDGFVEIAGEYFGYGNTVKIDHGTLPDNSQYKSLYGHMSYVSCTAGQMVKKGDIIGYVGSTGWSTGPHLHFEVIRNGIKINGLSMYNERLYEKLTYYL